MALSGSKIVAVTSQDNLVFSWTATQNRSDNTSTITWKMELVASSSGQITGVPEDTRTWTVTIDDQTYSGQNGVNIGNNETRLLAEGTTILAHEEDGTKTFDFTFSQQIQITWSGTEYIDTVSGSGTGELDTIVPIEKFDILGYINGYIMSICGRPVQWPKGEPVAFLYNGERLPPLPEWDKSVCPYAIIAQRVADPSVIFFKAFSAKQSVENGYLKTPSSAYFGSTMLAASGWGSVSCAYYTTLSSTKLSVEVPIWSNHDILNADGTVYLAASDPVPVYE